MANSIIPFTRSMKVGLGFDRLTGEVSSSPAVVSPSVTAIAGAGGQFVTSDCLIVEDVENLHKTLGVTAEAGGSYMGFSASAKVDYLNSFDFSRFSVYVVVKVSVRNAFESMDSPVFSTDAEELLKLNNSERFHKRFGDCFIAGVQKGGEYFAIYQVSSTQQTETEKTATDVRAAFGNPAMGASLHTKIETAMTNSSSHLEVNVFVFRQGTISKADIALEDIMNTAREFPISVAGDQSFAFEVLLQPFDRLKSPNDDFDFLQIQNQQQVLEDLAKKRFEFLTLRDDYAYILKHTKDFQKSDGSPIIRDELIKAHAQVVAAINTMEKEAEACARDAKSCQFTSFEVGTFDVPVLAESKMDALAERGLNVARQDPLAMAIRTLLPAGLTQRGFDLCMAVAEGQTAPGPGKQRFHDELPTSDEKRGFEVALPFILERNRHLERARAGAAVAQANPIVQKARDAEPAGMFTLGFDIATGIFGDPKQGAQGNTANGPGAQSVHDDLSGDARRGFDTGRKLNLGPPPLRS